MLNVKNSKVMCEDQIDDFIYKQIVNVLKKFFSYD